MKVVKLTPKERARPYLPKGLADYTVYAEASAPSIAKRYRNLSDPPPVAEYMALVEKPHDDALKARIVALKKAEGLSHLDAAKRAASEPEMVKARKVIAEVRRELTSPNGLSRDEARMAVKLLREKDPELTRVEALKIALDAKCGCDQ